jgi:DNA repair exonuclease SbcCD ATPase subunit
MTPQEIRQEFAARFMVLQKKQHENDYLKSELQKRIDKISECTESILTVRDGLSFLYSLANTRRGAMKGKIEDVVSEALRLIYGPEYKVELTYSVKNNRSSLSIEMVRDTAKGAVRREIGGFGGGVADTISVPMRLMVLLGAKQNSKICVLDECYKHVDGERIELVAEFLKALSSKLGMQILMCTHHEVIKSRADKTYSVVEDNGKSTVRER